MHCLGIPRKSQTPSTFPHRAGSPLSSSALSPRVAGRLVSVARGSCTWASFRLGLRCAVRCKGVLALEVGRCGGAGVEILQRRVVGDAGCCGVPTLILLSGGLPCTLWLGWVDGPVLFFQRVEAHGVCVSGILSLGVCCGSHFAPDLLLGFDCILEFFVDCCNFLAQRFSGFVAGYYFSGPTKR